MEVEFDVVDLSQFVNCRHYVGDVRGCGSLFRRA